MTKEEFLYCVRQWGMMAGGDRTNERAVEVRKFDPILANRMQHYWDAWHEVADYCRAKLEQK